MVTCCLCGTRRCGITPGVRTVAGRRGGQGTNQYRQKTRLAGAASQGGSLMAQAQPETDAGRAAPQYRCGDIWGDLRYDSSLNCYVFVQGRCARPVGPPRWHCALHRPGSNGRVVAARQETTPPEVLRFLAKDRSAAVRRALVHNKMLPAQVLQTLAGDPDWEVRAAAARSFNSTPEMLRRAAHDPDTQVRHDLASHLGLPGKAPWDQPAVYQELVVTLAADPTPQVRGAIAALGPERLPGPLFETLSRDPAGYVRVRTVAKVPVAWLSRLAADPDPQVRAAVAGYRDDIPLRLLVRLANDPDPEIARAVASNEHTPPRCYAMLADHCPSSVARDLVRRDKCPLPALELFASHQDYVVRREVISHRRCTPDLLARLSRDGSAQVRMAVVQHRWCPPEAVVRLARDHDPEIAGLAADHPNCPAHVRAMWMLAH